MEDNFWEKMFESAENNHKKQENGFKKLCQELPILVKKGDKVIVAVGLLGRGFEWIRKECEVMETANISIKIRCQDTYYKDGFWEEWIHPALITDVIKEENL